MHVVIVAGGLGSRLAPQTNFIPKFLVNIGKNTGYVEQVRYWMQFDPVFKIEDDLLPELSEAEIKDLKKRVMGSLTVIVHSNYAALIKAYHELYFPDIPLIVKTVDVHNGSAHAILSTCDHLVGKSVFFQWCDVMPAPDVLIPVKQMAEYYGSSNVIFTNYDFPNRYALDGHWHDRVPVKSEDSTGGIFGLYYISDYQPSKVQYTDGQDFVEVIEQFGPIREHHITKIVDWGDIVKLDQTRDQADKAREFNRVTFHGDLVLKEALNKQGMMLIWDEIHWYKELISTAAPVPAVWFDTNQQSFVMTRVYADPAYIAFNKADSESQHLILNKVVDAMRKIHGAAEVEVPFEKLLEDVTVESFTKLHTRCSEIRKVISAFGDVKVVNGMELPFELFDPGATIKELNDVIVQSYSADTKYNLIHGDLQMSNSMIDKNWEVTIIDPRGYFGTTKLYGLADYDYGKLLYSLSGYDLFNYSRQFHIEKLQDGEIKFTIPQTRLSEECLQEMKKIFKPVHYYWLAVNWIGLAQYIKNDPVKSVCAYYHGLYLANKFIHGNFTLS
jgi:hypothetical protein